MSINPLYISAEKLAEMKKEIEYLKTFKRREIADRIEKAKDLGDLSENADYTDAKEDLSANELRIVKLDNDIRSGIVIETQGGDQVAIGNTVQAKVNGKDRVLKVVGAAEADPMSGQISNESPIGLALLGRKAGDKVTVQAPAGPVEYEIIAIS
ncbi:MAG: transcription elongation factor GreA [Patescibacteria group bacterium]|nr:transcription elongation factor GreA [Patescibacteria group bacterium]